MAITFILKSSTFKITAKMKKDAGMKLIQIAISEMHQHRHQNRKLCTTTRSHKQSSDRQNRKDINRVNLSRIFFNEHLAPFGTDWFTRIYKWN